MSNDIAFSYAIGSGALAEQAQYLTKSIQLFTSSPEIYTFIPQDEWEMLSAPEKDYFEKNTNIRKGSFPIEGYPISAKLAAMQFAAEETSRSYVSLLDTDTVVLNEIDCHYESSAQLFVKPADGDEQYWVAEDASSDWKRVYSMLDRNFPGYTHETTVSKLLIPPYWNAGFVMTSDHDLPGQWLSETSTVYASDLPETFFADQLALGSLSTEYTVEELDNRYNYPLPHLYRCPSNIRVLHYHDFQPCGRVFTPSVRNKLRKIGVTQSNSFPTLSKQLRLFSGVIRNAFTS